MKKHLPAILLTGSALWLMVVTTVAGPPKPHQNGTPIHASTPHKPVPIASAQPTPRHPQPTATPQHPHKALAGPHS
ncbi:MAG: hypothetical protein JO271_17605 [Verrucomicrobia bacterium]|nr:hypothetical protein [Verrucomicrobiota bacterium]MBV9276511.1 hypothetical protein [Verrucomicrobiota bacterium]